MSHVHHHVAPRPGGKRLLILGQCRRLGANGQELGAGSREGWLLLNSHSWPLHDFLQINHRIFQDIVSWASSYSQTRRKGFGRLRSGQGREWVMVAKSRPVVAQFPLRPALPLASTLVSTFLGGSALQKGLLEQFQHTILLARTFGFRAGCNFSF